MDGLALGRGARLRLLARALPGANRFAFIGLAEGRARRGAEPLLTGQCARGVQAAHNWIELGVLAEEVAHPEGGTPILVAGTPLERRVLRRLAEAVPRGGHLMVEYESPQRRATFEGLSRGIPPVATPLGYALFLAGAGDSFKDWYYAEGGMEGPRKLQGNRALNADDRRRKRAAVRRELEAFLRTRETDPLHAAARAKARSVLGRKRS